MRAIIGIVACGASGSRNLAFTLPRSPQLYHPMTMTMVMAMEMAMGMVVAVLLSRRELPGRGEALRRLQPVNALAQERCCLAVLQLLDYSKSPSLYYF